MFGGKVLGSFVIHFAFLRSKIGCNFQILTQHQLLVNSKFIRFGEIGKSENHGHFELDLRAATARDGAGVNFEIWGMFC